MKAMILYDSLFGNTAQIAQTIAEALGSPAVVTLVHLSKAKVQDLQKVDVLIVGSPTQNFRPTKALGDFLAQLPANCLAGVNCASFDTRMSKPAIKSAFLRWLVNLGGYAAKPLADQLSKLGAKLVVAPQGFLVSGKEGPLEAGEREKAGIWAAKILSVLSGHVNTAKV